jgi:hypothetical protein
MTISKVMMVVNQIPTHMQQPTTPDFLEIVVTNGSYINHILKLSNFSNTSRLSAPFLLGFQTSASNLKVILFFYPNYLLGFLSRTHYLKVITYLFNISKNLMKTIW